MLYPRVIFGVISSMWCIWATSSTAVRRPTPLRPASNNEPPGIVSTRSTLAMLSSTSLKTMMSRSRFSRPAVHQQSSSPTVACCRHYYLLLSYIAVVTSAHRLPVFSTSARRDVLLSAIGRLLLPALDFGTVNLLTSGLPRHSQYCVGSWKLIYFGNLTQTLCYNYVAIVVLEVTLT